LPSGLADGLGSTQAKVGITNYNACMIVFLTKDLLTVTGYKRAPAKVANP
jgi:hypothetical protein